MKILAAFPVLTDNFFNLFGERLAVNNFSDERLKAAVGYLLDNYKYPTPSIADIISFDKKIKLYSYSDVLEQLDKGKSFDDFAKIKRDNKLFWVRKTEKEMFNIPDNL